MDSKNKDIILKIHEAFPYMEYSVNFKKEEKKKINEKFISHSKVLPCLNCLNIELIDKSNKDEYIFTFIDVRNGIYDTYSENDIDTIYPYLLSNESSGAKTVIYKMNKGNDHLKISFPENEKEKPIEQTYESFKNNADIMVMSIMKFFDNPEKIIEDSFSDKKTRQEFKECLSNPIYGLIDGTIVVYLIRKDRKIKYTFYSRNCYYNNNLLKRPKKCFLVYNIKYSKPRLEYWSYDRKRNYAWLYLNNVAYNTEIETIYNQDYINDLYGSNYIFTSKGQAIKWNDTVNNIFSTKQNQLINEIIETMKSYNHEITICKKQLEKVKQCSTIKELNDVKYYEEEL